MRGNLGAETTQGLDNPAEFLLRDVFPCRIQDSIYTSTNSPKKRVFKLKALSKPSILSMSCMYVLYICSRHVWLETGPD